MDQQMLDEYVHLANEKIKERVRYGLREEVAETRSIVFEWSNGGAHWWHWYDSKKRGEKVTLDANQIMLPYRPRKLMREAQKHFMVLPLYSDSFEYVWLGERAENVG